MTIPIDYPFYSKSNLSEYYFIDYLQNIAQ